MRMNSQTRIIVATAIALAGIDIAVRVATAPKNYSTGVVTAREFRLTDDRGNVRMTITTDNAGEPGMRMFDQDGKLRMQLDSWQNTPSLILFDKDQNRRVYYGMNNDDGSGLMTVMDANGSEIARLDASGDHPEMTLLNNGQVYQSSAPVQTYQSEVSCDVDIAQPALR